MAGKVNEEVMRVAETLQMLMDHLKCPICLETLRDAVSTQCGHTFCQMCIHQIIKDNTRNATCPLCNFSVKRRGISVNEKTRNIVQSLHVMMASAKKDVAECGYDDIFQFSKERRPSTKESFSPPKCNDTSKATVAPEPKRHSRVTSWLMQLGNPTSQQESGPSAHEGESVSNEDSDVEMVSVSQINPDQNNVVEVPVLPSKKSLSAHIEDDVNSAQSKNKTVTLKTKPSFKSSAVKKVGAIKTRQKSLKTIISPCKAGPSTATKERSHDDVPQPVEQEGKENSTNPYPTRSPGWSRVQMMKKEFHQQSNVLRTVNSKEHLSPVPAIEDPVSSDEGPCLNLSLTSPVLKKKAKLNEIVSELASEIQIFETSCVTVEGNGDKKKASRPPCSTLTLIDKPLEEHGLHNTKSSVKFLKLGNISSRKRPSVPIYLKGSLEHLHCVDVSNFAYRLLSDAQTQTNQGMNTSEGLSTSPATKSNLPAHESPITLLSNSRNRRSGGSNAGYDVDMMDAETVVFSPPVASMRDRFQNAVDNPPSLDIENNQISQKKVSTQRSTSLFCSQDEKEMSCMSIGSRQSETPSVIFSQDLVEDTTQKIPFDVTSHSVAPVDLDESTSSIIDTKRSKRTQILRSSSESSDSDVGVSKRNSLKRKKIRKQVVSDNEESGPNDLNITVGDTMEILANIEAQLEEGTQPQVHKENSDQFQPKPIHKENIYVRAETSTVQIDSDDEEEVINPTPQKQPSVMSRSVTQSYDIVPSSQPVEPDHDSSLSVLTKGPKGAPQKNDSSSDLTNEVVSISTDPQPTVGVVNKPSSHVPPVTPAQELLKTDSVSKSCDAPVALTNLSAKKPVFVCSSIPGTLAIQVKKLASIVGGEFCSKFSDDTTHLIVRVDENNRADKTLKYLCAVAAGKWVVSFAWVQKCLEAKKLVPEEPFEANDTSGDPGPRRSREARLANKYLFSNFEFCCIGDFPDLSKTQLETLLIQSGGSVVSNPIDFSFRDNVVPVTLALWDESKEVEYSSWLDRYSTPLVQHEWVLDCIGKFCVTSFSTMLICDASDDALSAMGIPAYLFEYTDSEQ